MVRLSDSVDLEPQDRKSCQIGHLKDVLLGNQLLVRRIFSPQKGLKMSERIHKERHNILARGRCDVPP